MLKESLAKVRRVETVLVAELVERLGPGVGWACGGDAQELVHQADMGR